MIYLFSSEPETIEKYFRTTNREYELITKETFTEFGRTYVAKEGDVGIVYDFGKMIPESLLEKFLLLNIHFSLLPKYRGATPVEAAILAGENETGITIQKMVKGMDEGDVLNVKNITIDEKWTAGELQFHMDSLVPELLGKILSVPQNEWSFSVQVGEPSYCYMKLLGRPNAELHPREITVTEFVSKVRGFNPEPFAWMNVLKKGEATTINILRAEPYHELSVAEGDFQFVKKKGLVLGTKDGGVLVTELVVAGSKVLKGGDIVSLKENVTIA